MRRNETRRNCLKATLGSCLTVVFAGCIGDDTDATGDNDDDGTDNGESTETGDEDVDDTDPGDETDITEDGEPQVELHNSEIISDEDGTNWIQSEVENKSDSDHGRLEVYHEVFDENGDVVDTQDALIDFVPAADVWRDYREVLGQRRDDAEKVESEIRNKVDSQSAAPIEGPEVIDSTLNQDYGSGTEIVGQLANDDTPRDQIYLAGLVYTGDGILRGSVGEIIRDLDAGEERSFRAAIADNRTPRDREEELPTEHEVYVFENIP